MYEQRTFASAGKLDTQPLVHVLAQVQDSLFLGPLLLRLLPAATVALRARTTARSPASTASASLCLLVSARAPVPASTHPIGHRRHDALRRSTASGAHRIC